MAIISYTTPGTELKGSIGSTTLQHATAGYIMRSRPYITVNPLPSQITYQNRLSSLVALWPSLTAAEVLSWETLAKPYGRIDDWGVSQQPSAFQYFLSANMNLLLLGQAPIKLFPGWWYVLQPGIFTLSATVASFDLHFTAQWFPLSDLTYFWATPPLRMSSLKCRRSIQFLGGFFDEWYQDYDLKTAYESVFNLSWPDLFNYSDCSIIIHCRDIMQDRGLSQAYRSVLFKLN
jgi:hypothetical protein